MAPGAIWRQPPGQFNQPSTVLHRFVARAKSSLLNRSINVEPYRVKQGVGNYYLLQDGTEVYDASGGAAVASLGRRDKRVEEAMHKIQKLGLSYISSSAFDTDITAEAADFMVQSTDNMMKKVGFYCSGKNIGRTYKASLTRNRL